MQVLCDQISNWRTCPTSDTFKKIEPFFSEFGITRIANITGLDRIGVPVYVSYRPLARTLCVSAGKGLTHMQAKVSAAMESIELFHAETMTHELIFESYANLNKKAPTLPIELLPLARHSIFNDHQVHPWIYGTNLVTNTKIYIPFECVSINPTDNRIHLPVFQSSTNGLASGNTDLEARISALFELIERDGTTISIELANNGYEHRIIAIESIEYENTRQLLRQLDNHQLDSLIIDCTTDIDIPIFICILFDKQRPNLGGFMGAGCHLNPQIALERAISEACQSRGVYFSGARDDLLAFKHEYIKHTYPPLPSTQQLHCNPFPSFPSASALHETMYDTIIQNLKTIGITHVIEVDLTKTEYKIPIKKLLIPQLEGYLSKSYQHGNRIKQLISKRVNNG